MALFQLDGARFGISQTLLPAANIFVHCRNPLDPCFAITAQLIMCRTAAHHSDPAGFNGQANVLHPCPRSAKIFQAFPVGLCVTQLHARFTRLFPIACDSERQCLNTPAGKIALRLSPRQRTPGIGHHPICGLARLAGLLIGFGQGLQLTNQRLMRGFRLACHRLRLFQL